MLLLRQNSPITSANNLYCFATSSNIPISTCHTSATTLLARSSTDPLRKTVFCPPLPNPPDRRSSHLHTCPPPPTSSVQTPNSFSTHWYQDTVIPLDIEAAVHHIPNPDTNVTPLVDHNFIDNERRVMALIDYAVSSPQAKKLLDDVHHALSQNAQLYGHEARVDLRRALSTALLRYGAPPGFSALAIQFNSNLLRMAWAGSCGIILIRDDRIAYRSYEHVPPRDALENVLSKPQDKNPEVQRQHWLKWGGRASPSATGGYIDGALAEASVQGQGFSIDCKEVHADFIELEDNDLIIVGSDGFFANVSEEQILAFVRPVPDAEDKTLAIANNTCLGSWRNDDVDFIAYYLAIIALNFATATNSKPHLPFPFPPSPHVDDITVMCIACSFQ